MDVTEGIRNVEGRNGNIGAPQKPGIVVPEDIPLREPAPYVEPAVPAEPTKKEPVPV